MITLDPDHSLPLYRQLYDRLRAQILSGELAPDSRLPSVRELVQELSVSRNTVEGAYLELYAEGYIYSKPRSGYFVSPLDQEVAPRSLAEAPENPSPLPEPAVDCRFDFHPARLDPGSFPVEIWRRCFVESLRESPAGLVQYGHPQGEPELRLSLKTYLERARQAGLRLLPISDFYLTGEPELTTLLLGFGSLPLEEIDGALGELARLCG